MIKQKLSPGVVHNVPADLRKSLLSTPKAVLAWEDITPLARERRIKRVSADLSKGERRPCC
jgi:hypothetical protein